MKDLQMAEFRILKAVRDVCEKYDIAYFLSCGTLLGAVRHQGFIPWDDDVDIMMPYSDYYRFLEIAPKALGPDFFVQNTQTEENWYCAYTKVRLNHTTMMREHQAKHKIHQGVWLDIFPLAPVQTQREWNAKRKLIKWSNLLLMDEYFKVFEEDFAHDFSRTTVWALKMLLALPRGFRRKLHRLAMKILESHRSAQKAAEVWNTLGDPFSYSYLVGPETKLDFEGEKFRVPPQYKEYLTDIYGDYMTPPPVEERVGHGELIVDLKRDYSYYTGGK